MKDPFTIKCMIILAEFFQNANVNLGKGTVLSSVSFIWLKKLNKQEIIITFFAAVPRDLSKAFDSIKH